MYQGRCAVWIPAHPFTLTNLNFVQGLFTHYPQPLQPAMKDPTEQPMHRAIRLVSVLISTGIASACGGDKNSIPAPEPRQRGARMDAGGNIYSDLTNVQLFSSTSLDALCAMTVPAATRCAPLDVLAEDPANTLRQALKSCGEVIL